MNKDLITKIKQANTDQQAQEIIHEIKSLERLIIYALINTEKQNFIKNEISDWQYKDIEKEKCLRIYIDITNICKEHYLSVKEDD